MKKFALAALAAICALAPAAFFCGCGEGAPAQLKYTLSPSGDYYVVSGVSGSIKSFTSCEIPATYGEEGGARLPVKEIGQRAFEKCYALTSVTIPDSVTKIDSYAFIYCGFEKITLPEGLEEMGEAAFGNCQRLKEITVPQSVKDIGKSAFIYCSGLKKAVIKAQITELKEQVFYNHSPQNAGSIFLNTALKDVYLPATLKKAHYSALWGNALENIYFAGSEEEWKAFYFYELVPKKSGSTEYVEKVKQKSEALGSAAEAVRYNVKF